MKNNNKYDTLIIGAGVSGLMAAYIIAMQGQQVCVVEKSDHPGGRVACKEIDGEVLQHGAMWVHDSTHPVMMSLASEGQYQQYNSSNKLLSFNNF